MTTSNKTYQIEMNINPTPFQVGEFRVVAEVKAASHKEAKQKFLDSRFEDNEDIEMFAWNLEMNPFKTILIK